MSRLLHVSLVIGLAAASAACATTGATPAPFPRPAPPGPSAGAATPGPRPTAPGASHSSLGYEVTGTALRLRGAPYRNGGSDPAGFDCSGFVKYVFGENGISMPRTVTDQFRAGRKVESQLQAGDLVFFSTISPGASHVGIVIGGNEFVHAPSGAGEVRVERLSAPYWSTRFVGARRVL